MLDGFLDSDAGSNIVVTISDIPAIYQTSGYSLYLYTGAPEYAASIVNSYDSFGAISLGTTTNYYHSIDLSLWNGIYLQATDSNENDPAPPDANYVVFTNLSSASVTVVVAPHPILGGPASLSGFQLVANTVPSAVSIAVTQQGGNLVLSWSGQWVLQTSATLGSASQWQDLPTAISPYMVPTPLQSHQFYRLRSP
jgi:hypothetical protein